MRKTFKIVSLALITVLMIILCTGCSTTTTSSNNTSGTPTLTVGETWTVDGQWSLTITDVEKTSYRNEFDDSNPAEVVYITYTYENLGYTDSTGLMDGLYLDLSSAQIVDGTGEMGSSYPGIDTEYPDQVPVGARMTAKVCIGIQNTSNQLTLNYSTYDSNYNKQSAKFILDL